MLFCVWETEIHPGDARAHQDEHQKEMMIIINVVVTIIGWYDDDGHDARDCDDVEHHTDHGPDEVFPDDC